MPRYGWRQLVIYPNNEEARAACRLFTQEKHGGRSVYWAEHDNHIHGLFFLSSENDYIRYFGGNGFKCKTRRVCCKICFVAYLSREGRHIFCQHEGGGAFPLCAYHEVHPEESGWRGCDGVLAACGNRKRHGTEDVPGSDEEEGDISNRVKREKIHISDGEHAELLSRTMDAICPATISQLTAHLVKEGQVSLTLQKAYENNAMRILSAKKLVAKWWSFEECIEKYASIQDQDHERYLSVEGSINVFNDLMDHNGIPRDQFIRQVYEVVNRVNPKLNTLFLKGQANSGKTLLLESIARACVYPCRINSFTGNSAFELADLQDARIGIFNEPTITETMVNTMKAILEGAKTAVNVKYKSCQEVERTPILIASNQDLAYMTMLPSTHESVLLKRCHKYNMRTADFLKEVNYNLNPLMWRELLKEL